MRITEASFTFPKEHCYSEKLVDLIELMLKRDPEERPDQHVGRNCQPLRWCLGYGRVLFWSGRKGKSQVENLEHAKDE